MKKANKFLIVSMILCLVSLSCKAQLEKKEPSPKVIDAFYNSDTTLMAKYLESGEYPIGYNPIGLISPLESAIDNNRINVIPFLINQAKLEITDGIITAILYNENFNVDTVNYLFSVVSGKEEIDFTKWKEKHLIEWEKDSFHRGILRVSDYGKFRLLVMYGFALTDWIGQEQRTEFYITMLEIEDWELLDLLDYNDKEGFDGHTCYGPTVLTSAVYTKNYNLVKFLLAKGLDKSIRIFDACYDEAEEGANAYEIAEEYGDKEMMELLK